MNTTDFSPKVHLEYWRKLFKDKAQVKELSGHRSKVHTLHWNCIGTLLASGSADHTIRIWSRDGLLSASQNTENIPHFEEIKGHEGSVDQLAWSPCQPYWLASVAADRTCRLWEVDVKRASFRCLDAIPLASDNINLAWSPTGQHLAISSKDDQLSVIEFGSNGQGRLVRQRKFAHEVNELAWSPDGMRLLVTRGNGSIEVLAYPTLETVIAQHAHPANCYCIRFNPAGNHFAVGSADALVSYWEWPSLVCLRTFSRLDWPIRAISFSGDGRLMVAASEDSHLDISWVETGEWVAKIPVLAAVNALAWHPSHNILAYASEQVDDKTGRPTGTIHIYSVVE